MSYKDLKFRRNSIPEPTVKIQDGMLHLTACESLAQQASVIFTSIEITFADQSTQSEENITLNQENQSHHILVDKKDRGVFVTRITFTGFTRTTFLEIGV